MMISLMIWCDRSDLIGDRLIIAKLTIIRSPFLLQRQIKEKLLNPSSHFHIWRPARLLRRKLSQKSLMCKTFFLSSAVRT